MDCKLHKGLAWWIWSEKIIAFCVFHSFVHIVVMLTVNRNSELGIEKYIVS